MEKVCVNCPICGKEFCAYSEREALALLEKHIALALLEKRIKDTHEAVPPPQPNLGIILVIIIIIILILILGR